VTKGDSGLPPEWTERHDETRHGAAVVEYQHETADETTFIVSVTPRTDTGEFTLRLSTIDPASTHVRHDYPVDEYDTVEEAAEGAESFVETLSQRLRAGSISSADPNIDAIRETIQAFRGNRGFPSVRQLLRRFR
jgi:quercetin dioxygenase-like cupin family protein